MGAQIGKVGKYFVYWDSFSGHVYVGDEYAGKSYSKAGAMEVARNYVGRWS